MDSEGTEKADYPSLHDSMAAHGAETLRVHLLAMGQVPSHFLKGDCLLRVCRQVQAEWLRGEIATPLYGDLIQIVSDRLREVYDDTPPEE